MTWHLIMTTTYKWSTAVAALHASEQHRETPPEALAEAVEERAQQRPHVRVPESWLRSRHRMQRAAEAGQQAVGVLDVRGLRGGERDGVRSAQALALEVRDHHEHDAVAGQTAREHLRRHRRSVGGSGIVHGPPRTPGIGGRCVRSTRNDINDEPRSCYIKLHMSYGQTRLAHNIVICDRLAYKR